MPIATYEDALSFWYGRVNYEQRGMPDDVRELKLDRMHRLLELLGWPEARLRILHVAGSKGKGSTAATLAAILQASGYRTGLFTSPHLTHVEERVQINGTSITPAQLTQLLRELEPLVLQVEAEHHVGVTFFEIMTALGLLHFAREIVDFVVLEVGLGGRFDATNVCTPLVSVITSISLDHVQQLGDTTAAIAFEKAGIIKPGVPVVSGVTDAAAAAVIRQRAQAENALLRELGRDFTFDYEPAHLTTAATTWPHVRWRGDTATSPWLRMRLLGVHQAANAAVAIATIEALRTHGWRIPADAVAEGLVHVHWPARLEVLARSPWIILDCSHNAASAEAVVNTLFTSFPPARRILIFAASRDKDLAAMLRILAPHFHEAIFTRYLSSARSADPVLLAEIWRGLTTSPCTVADAPRSALEQARSLAACDDMLCITGSVFLAGELRPLLVPS